MITAERTDTDAPIDLIVDKNGPVTGLTAVVAIRDGRTADSYLDFADATFKAAGWTTRQAALADIGGGVYSLAGGLDLSAITNLPAATNHLIAEYEVSGAETGVAAETLVIPAALYALPTAADVAGVQTTVDTIDGKVDIIDTNVDALGVALAAVASDVTGLVASVAALPSAAANAAAVWAADVTGETFPAAGRMLDRIRVYLTNRNEIDFTGQQLVAYEDNGTTVAQRWNLTTEGAEPVAAVTGAATKRSDPVDPL